MVELGHVGLARDVECGGFEKLAGEGRRRDSEENLGCQAKSPWRVPEYHVPFEEGS